MTSEIPAGCPTCGALPCDQVNTPPSTEEVLGLVERDWTLTDKADAADAQRHREWWKSDPFANHFADEPEEGDDDE